MKLFEVAEGSHPVARELEGVLRLLVIQPTPFCNIDCSYCYLPDRTSTARMDLNLLETAFRRVFESPFVGRHLDVAWHAGEPLIVPIPWYEEAFSRITKHLPSGVTLTHRFQTNGLLLNADWARFFGRSKARVGLSLDGPEHLHNACRRTRAGLGTHEAVMRALRILQEQGLSFDVITVLSDASLNSADELFNFYVDNGIAEVGFNIEEIEGAHLNSSLRGSHQEARFRHFLFTFLRLVWGCRGRLRIREIEYMLDVLIADKIVTDDQNVPFRIVSIAHDGALSTYSPELLSARHSRFATFTLGNVADGPIAGFMGTPFFQAMADEINKGVGGCARECRYFRWCGGGAPANKIFETGRFDATETMHCRLGHQVIFDVVLAELERRLA